MDEGEYNRFIEAQNQQFRSLYSNVEIDIDDNSFTGIGSQVGNIYIKKKKASSSSSKSKSSSIVNKKQQESWLRIFIFGIGNGALGGVIAVGIAIFKNLVKTDKTKILF